MNVINGISGMMNGTSGADQVTQSDPNQDMFLQLLVEQLKNQDPMSPMDSQDFVAQMAEFSSLEKLQSIDDNVAEGTDMNYILTQSINNTMAATLIGREVCAVGDTVSFNGSDAVDIQFRLQDNAENVAVIIKDDSGKVVRELSAEEFHAAGDNSITWDGRDADGIKLSEGLYSVEVNAQDGSGNAVTSTPLMAGLVSSVRFGEGNAYLLVNGTEISFSDVLEISMVEG